MIRTRLLTGLLGTVAVLGVLHGCAGGGESSDQGFTPAAGGKAGSDGGQSEASSSGGSAGSATGGAAGSSSKGGAAGSSEGGAAGTGGSVEAEEQPEAGPDAEIESGLEAGQDAAEEPQVEAGCTGLCKSAGMACDADADCESGLCKPVLLGSTDNKVCVVPCKAQADCDVFGEKLFCEPVAALSADGYCVPQSPAHCLSCTTEADCGSLSEACLQAPGDQVKACHVDCSIAGAAACPSDYSCVDLQVNGASRKMCRPNVPFCLDANGGFCDRVTAPQACIRTNSAGMCVGQRTCLAGPDRFTACNALAPSCKQTCSTQNQAGCDEQYCPDAANQPTGCGTCDNDCTQKTSPTTANAMCQGTPLACAFSCKGENYNVDKAFPNGCEVVDSPLGNHAEAQATAGPNFGSCSDGSSSFNLGGIIPSDQSVHENPAASGFVAATGSAPDWIAIGGGSGWSCLNDFSVTLNVAGSSSPSCYKLTFKTDQTSASCNTDASGTCNVSKGSNSYSNDSLMHAIIEKTCSSAALAEKVTYSISGHL